MKRLFTLLATAALAVGLSMTSSAALILQDAGTSGDDWNAAIWGGGNAPTAGNDYQITSAVEIHSTSSFLGDSIIIAAGTDLDIESALTATANFVFDGGKLDANPGGSSPATFEGTMEFLSDSIIDLKNNVWTFNASLTGSGGMNVSETLTNATSLILASGGTYSGTMDFDFDATSSEVQFTSSYTNALVNFQDGRGGTLNLSDAFTVAGFTRDGITLNPGTYTATDLTTLGMTNISDNGGSVTVIPEPAVGSLLLCVAGVLLVFRRRVLTEVF